MLKNEPVLIERNGRPMVRVRPISSSSWPSGKL